MEQIAAYLNRDVRTVQHWERREQFPVRRQIHCKLGSVLAFKDELDRWMDQRCSLQSEKAGATNLHAYELYFKGRQVFHQFRRKNFERVREMFARAIELDSEFAAAHAGFADCCSYLYLYWEATRENLEAADSASRNAVELAPKLAEAHASRGMALSTLRNYPGGIPVFTKRIISTDALAWHKESTEKQSNRSNPQRSCVPMIIKRSPLRDWLTLDSDAKPRLLPCMVGLSKRPDSNCP